MNHSSSYWDKLLVVRNAFLVLCNIRAKLWSSKKKNVPSHCN